MLLVLRHQLLLNKPPPPPPPPLLPHTINYNPLQVMDNNLHKDMA